MLFQNSFFPGSTPTHKHTPLLLLLPPFIPPFPLVLFAHSFPFLFPFFLLLLPSSESFLLLFPFLLLFLPSSLFLLFPGPLLLLVLLLPVTPSPSSLSPLHVAPSPFQPLVGFQLFSRSSLSLLPPPSFPPSPRNPRCNDLGREGAVGKGEWRKGQ